MPKSKTREKESFGEILKTIFYALLIALAFRIFLFQPFSIPSSSMKSTLLIGDYLFVSKYAYGYSRHSIPFSPPLFEGRILGQEPKRGDVIVFKNRNDGNKDYIKRLIGLPGDVIQVTTGRLKINGEFVQVEQIDDFAEPRVGRGQECLPRREIRDGVPFCLKEQYLETFEGGEPHTILNADLNRGGYDNTGEYVVPAGHFFFMGDNRDNSGDSRRRTVGYVPFEDLIGRAEIIFLSSESGPFSFWKWRFSRFFQSID